jgi:hypothetical protein
VLEVEWGELMTFASLKNLDRLSDSLVWVHWQSSVALPELGFKVFSKTHVRYSILSFEKWSSPWNSEIRIERSYLGRHHRIFNWMYCRGPTYEIRIESIGLLWYTCSFCGKTGLQCVAGRNTISIEQCCMNGSTDSADDRFWEESEEKAQYALNIHATRSTPYLKNDPDALHYYHWCAYAIGTRRFKSVFWLWSDKSVPKFSLLIRWQEALTDSSYVDASSWYANGVYQ